VISQSIGRDAGASAPPLSSARATDAADTAHEARSVIESNAEENFFKVRFIFIYNTTVFKIFELRGGGLSNRAAIILIKRLFAKPDIQQSGEGVCRMPAKKA
jgi:hypothetical protein